ncbi:hypothetical protein LTR66_008748 [Elasticomyces elasticus]|nr:hypothetical protein LTR66_008748 [Elasticomyces elasticus]
MRRNRNAQTMHAKPSAIPDPMSLIRAYDHDMNPTRPVRPSPLTASTIQGLPLDLLDRLRNFPLFLSAPDSFLGAIGKYLRPQLYQPHDYILTQGDDAKSMYWLVRGSVRVTSRDGESTYAELKPGAFFGEIGILMDIPRTATIVAKMRSLVVRLNKEDLQKELPNYPDVERAIREEAIERLAILERKKKENVQGLQMPILSVRKRSHEWVAGDVHMGEAGELVDGEVLSNKKLKSPSTCLMEAAASSALGSAPLTVRQLLKELPLFAGLPPEILHYLGMNAKVCNFPPFTNIIKQDSPGRDVYFIARGEVEVVTSPSRRGSQESRTRSLSPNIGEVHRVRARLKSGQYFGEVTSLCLAPRRTATVRTVNAVECLLITGDVLDELWAKCSPDLRQQVEQEAKRRLKAAEDGDVVMKDAYDGPSLDPTLADGNRDRAIKWRQTLPTVTFSDSGTRSSALSDDKPVIEPLDPDPFTNVELDNMRSKSRRGSVAPPSPDGVASGVADYSIRQPSPPNGRYLYSSPLKPRPKSPKSPTETVSPPSDRRVFSQDRPRRPKLDVRRPSQYDKGVLPEALLILIFAQLDLLTLMRLRLVSTHWLRLLTSSPDILHTLDLASHNRRVTDAALASVICPFVGSRPRHIDISNCFHLTDEGFNVLASSCGRNVRSWRMKSVWDVTGQAVLEMVEKCRFLEEIDLSNCRKVGDNLLARVVGWVVPDLSHNPALAPAQPQNGRQAGHKRPQTSRGSAQPTANNRSNTPPDPPPGTVIGSPNLKHLTLSYCKHIQDRSMAHIAVHASSRLESIDLTRCTSITDQGFQHWSVYRFEKLRRLVLADCTYLSDAAIVGVTNACPALRELDLSFCCALSDTSTEVLALGLTHLTHLNLAFCGSAVSDSSLRCIGLHLLELSYLSVRGCVRVTGQGVEAVVDGCRNLEVFDVSQCRNLRGWIDGGGVRRTRDRGCAVRFDIVADGRWRAGKVRVV